MIATKYKISSGVGNGEYPLSSFDKALLNAGVGNYNLVRLSSILPANCENADNIDLPEGSLLPTAYSTISSNNAGDILISAIGVGIPEDKSNVGVIMEYSAINQTSDEAIDTLRGMIKEAFINRGWKLEKIEDKYAIAIVEKQGETKTTFACIAEW